MGSSKKWTVYILKCRGGSLYTGITTDLKDRLKKHRLGLGAAYTRSHRPIRVVHQEGLYTHSAALKREAHIKKWPRAKKILFLKTQ